MIDINRIPGDYKFSLHKVGFIRVKHNMKYLTKQKEILSSVGKFSILSDLRREIRGAHMSRPVRMLEYFDTHVYSNDNVVEFLQNVLQQCETEKVYFELEYEHEKKKRAPITGILASRYYNVIWKKSLQKDLGVILDLLVLTIPVTTSCACSKAISDYSSHNQRGYVTVSLSCRTEIWVEDIIDLVESAASCPIYPVLKRDDEKYVTETVYDNPNLVEDLVRNVAEKLCGKIDTDYFKVICRIEESILPYDSYAEVEFRR